MIQLNVHALNVRFGTMETENGSMLDWAKLTIVEDETISKQGFCGVAVGELPIDTADGNKIAKQIHSLANEKSLFPSNVVVHCEHIVKGKNVALLVKSLTVKP